jgi:hypothetical protein
MKEAQIEHENHQRLQSEQHQQTIGIADIMSDIQSLIVSEFEKDNQ